LPAKRRLCWVSCGAASAVATKLDIAKHSDASRLLAYTDPGSEHPDNMRFLRDLEQWFGQEIQIFRNPKYRDTWEVWEQTRFLVGPTGARCTAELKKKVRFGVQQPDDIQVFGYTAEEKHRADRFREINPDVNLSTPLIDLGLTKEDCLGILANAGIEIPVMYKLGYRNNNCIGCVKGGMGYWNKIRKDFPEVFERMARLERTLGNNVLHDDKGPVYLDELDPSRGHADKEPSFECSLLCMSAEFEINAR